MITANALRQNSWVPKVSLVVTVRNEATSLPALLASIAAQTQVPDEVVVVDGGSTDGTVAVLQAFATKQPKLNVHIIEQPGNIAVGRNTGIKAARHDWIAMTDAGCVLEKNWLCELLLQQQKTHASIVAGYAVGNPQSAFETAVVPYALVMPDRVDPAQYLPAARSLLLHKPVWQQLGGFPEHVSVSEDYAFARAARAAGVTLSFAQTAVVRWRPRSSLLSFFRMIYAQARDDVRAGNWRLKVGLVWVRYVAGAIVVVCMLLLSSLAVTLLMIGILLAVYSGWAWYKNYRYVARGRYWLPVLQIVADWGVMLGSATGFFWKLTRLRASNLPPQPKHS